jgi:nitronate monooxygenase
MNNGRRRFLIYAAGVGASMGIAERADAEERVSGALALSMRTKELLSSFGLKYPILQAPVGFASGPDLVIAVCRAGAMGSMALTRASPEDAKERVRKVLAATTGPFAVNFILGFEPRSLAAALEAGAPVIQFSWGIPDSQVVALIRGAGAKFGIQVASAEGARAALDAGADYLGLC